MIIRKKKGDCMRYASIRNIDISNGEGVGAALFVQGCSFQCPGCFNKETWEFSDGYEWNDFVMQRFLKLCEPSYIKRISILGGEPLHHNNLKEMYDLCNKLVDSFPLKKIWLYTGYKIEDFWGSERNSPDNNLRNKILSKIDVLVDGRYIEERRDISLKFRGSDNQRIIDVKKSLLNSEITLYKKEEFMNV